jgi:GNAT superfamily N-acetyltransferase
MDWTRGDLTVSCDAARLDVGAITQFLATTYWAAGIDEATVRRSIEHSLCFGLYERDAQIGFARVVTDRTSFAWLADVYVLPAYRGRGLARWMLECVLAHPELQGLRRWLLATRDAHELYRKLGFAPLARPERFMEINNPDVHRRAARPA